MKLHMPNAGPVKMDVTWRPEGGQPTAILLAFITTGIHPDDSADFVVWTCRTDDWGLSWDADGSGKYFHLSPGYTETDRDVALSQATAYFNDKRGVQIPPF